MNIFEQLQIPSNTKPALITSNRVLNYEDLYRETHFYAQLFKELRPKCIALYLDNGIEWILSDLAAHVSNIPVVPLPTFFSQSQLIHIIEDVGADLLITHETFNDNAALRLFQDTPVIRDENGNEFYQRTVSSQQRLSSEVAKITYTSGSTGTPKGVCLSTHSQISVAQSLKRALQPIEIKNHLCVLPLSTLLENIAGVWTALSTGACVGAPSLNECGFEGASQIKPAQFLETIQNYKSQSLILVPELLNVLVSGYEAGIPRPNDFKFIAVGGAKVSPSLLQRARELKLPVYEGYGLSECCSVVTLNLPDNDKSDTAGRPLPHATIRISNENEIEVSGSSMLRYLHQKRSSSTFRKTGDLGELDEEGFLKVYGRKKNMFITSYGRQVCPEWIEEALLHHACIKQTVVFGEALPFNICVLVLKDNSKHRDVIKKLIDQTNLTLPNYAKVSRFLISQTHFTYKNGTLTANGHVNRDEIWKKYQNEILMLIDDADAQIIYAASL